MRIAILKLRSSRYAYGLFALLISCAGDGPKPAPQAPSAVMPVQASSEPKKDPYAIPEPSAEQTKKAREASDKYFRALGDTILDIDDGVTSPDEIARSAVSRNLPLLRAMVLAKTAHIKESSSIGAKAVNTKLSQLPTNHDIDIAVYMVMKLRQKRGSIAE